MIDFAAAWDAQALTLEDARRATGADQPEMTAACLDAIRPFIPANPRRMLEIGCGIGRLTLPIAKDFPGAIVTALDASPRMLAHAGAASNVQWILAGHPPVAGVEGDVDFAWSVLVFQHLPPEVLHAYLIFVGLSLRWGGVFRFQLIEGTEHEPLSHHYDLRVIGAWLGSVGLSIAKVERGIGHERWTWITAEKNAGSS